MKNDVLIPKVIKDVLKDLYLFENIVLASKPQVIKVSSKSDMTVVWIDLWDSQSGSSANNIINCCFNIG